MRPDKKTEVIRRFEPIGILEGMPAEDLARLAILCHWRLFEKASEVVSAAADSTDVAYLVRGRVRASVVSAGGREVAFRELGPGASFGELSAIDGFSRSVSVVAPEDSVVAAMSREQFWALLGQHPSVALRVLKNLASLVRDLTARLVDKTTLTVPVRVRAELVRMAHEAGITDNTSHIPRFPIHADFASRIGATREAVTRELARLARQGLLQQLDTAMVVRDVESLIASIDSSSAG